MITGGDGVEIGEVVCDRRSGTEKPRVVSHAHTDHLPRAGGEAVCSELTAALAEARAGVALEPVDHPAVELVPSGHVPGSRAAVIEQDGERVLFTGDVCTRDRWGLDGFEPVEADVLVVETTYGRPAYTFPAVAELERDVLDWVAAHPDRPLVLAGYALGKAQTIQALVERSGRRVAADERVLDMNSVVAAHSDRTFAAGPLDGVGKLENELVVVPPGALRNGLAAELQREGALIAGFTGWARDRRTRMFDAAFPLSDHCGFDELVDLVEAVAPREVYTHHGADRAFARHVRRELGIPARALSDAQRGLTDFCAAGENGI